MTDDEKEKRFDTMVVKMIGVALVTPGFFWWSFEMVRLFMRAAGKGV